MPTFVGAKEKFASEYPDRLNPIGMRVTVRRDPAHDHQFVQPESRSDGLGTIINYDNARGLCFQVAHLEAHGVLAPGTPSRLAWYAPEELVDHVDALSLPDLRRPDAPPTDLGAFPTDLGAEISNL